ncbi:MAG: NADH-quinone oxidoreductase subunit L [Endomicrobiia bacterium]
MIITNSFIILFSFSVLLVGTFLARISTYEKISRISSLIALVLGLFGIISLSFRYFSNIESDFLMLKFKNWDIFILDSYALIMALTSIIIATLIVIYSFDYMSHYENQSIYYFYVTLFVTSMLGLTFSGNLIIMYICWELTSICSWQLIGFYRGNVHLSKANKSFLMTLLGSALMLVGICILYVEYGSANIYELKNKQISDTTALFLLSGMIAKSAQFPFHVWLPEAGVAPTPVTALLHAAVLVKIGIYSFGRIFNFTFEISQRFQEFTLVIFLSTILIAGFMALIETDIKRILAYSTISQLSYVFLGFVINITDSIKGAIFYILSHALSKAGLFLSAGIVEHNVNERDISKLGGLIQTMPVTSICFLICSFSIIGFPIFSGFWGKFFILKGALETQRIFVAFVAVAGSILTLLYLMRLYNSVFLGKKKFEIKEKTLSMVLVIVLLTLFSVVVGLFPEMILKLIKI